MSIRNIGKDVIHLPTNDAAEELITPFVMREKGGGTFIPPIIPAADDIDELVNVKYKFLHHQHQLTLLLSGDRSQEEEQQQDEENYGKRSELICDGCITPISSSSSSSSSSSKCYYYMSCSECKYNLHVVCFHLPPRVPSLPLHHHHLLLQSCDKLQPWQHQNCSVCSHPMNGLFYTCGECDFQLDIKCACMPDTILHAAHPQHLLKHVTQSDVCGDINLRRLSCAAGCGYDIMFYDCYKCCNSSCDFILDLKCVVLPASVSSRRWDKQHALLLTYKATLNRPGDFYCDQCETQMNPKKWMYHCRAYNISFHPKCFPTTSGIYRHVKLGQEYVIAAAHPHPLAFQLLTTKRRCHICALDNHGRLGFFCESCNFFICFQDCGEKLMRDGDVKAVD